MELAAADNQDGKITVIASGRISSNNIDKHEK
jgi:hypothetical protein